MDKQNIRLIILSIALVLSLWFNIKAIFFPPSIKKTIDEKEYVKTLDSLDNIIKYKENEIFILNQKNVDLFYKIDSLDIKLDENKKNLNKIKKYYDKKIDSINNYNVTDISNYFTNRYK